MRLIHRLMALALSCLILQGVHADECDAILEQGVRNTYQQLDKSDLKSGFSNALCTSYQNSSSSNQGGGLGLSLPIDGVPIGFNGNYDDAKINSIKNSSCGSSNGNLNDENFHAVLSMVADKNIVAAWSQCKQQGGTFLNVSVNGNSVVFELKFRAIGNVSSTKVTTAPQFIGVICPSPVIVKGLKLTGSTTLQACAREGSGEVTAIVNTEQNGVKAYVPAISAQQKPPFPGPLQTFPRAPLLLAMCLVPTTNMPAGTAQGLQASCEYFGPAGQPCSCPLFDGHGGIVTQMAGTSIPPNDIWWANVSPRHQGFDRVR